MGGAIDCPVALNDVRAPYNENHICWTIQQTEYYCENKKETINPLKVKWSNYSKFLRTWTAISRKSQINVCKQNSRDSLRTRFFKKYPVLIKTFRNSSCRSLIHWGDMRLQKILRSSTFSLPKRSKLVFELCSHCSWGWEDN